MQQRYHKYTIFFISGVILITLAIQVYWNYKNYETGKSQLIRDVQVSLDNAVEEYYSNIVKNNTKRFFNLDTNDLKIKRDSTLSSLAKQIESGNIKLNSFSVETKPSDDKKFPKRNESKQKHIDSILMLFPNAVVDSLNSTMITLNESNGSSQTSFKISSKNRILLDSFSKRLHKNLSKTGETKRDTSRFEAFESLTSKIVISLDDKIFNKNEIDSLFLKELERKNLEKIDHELLFVSGKNLYSLSQEISQLSVNSNSTLLPKDSLLKAKFQNVTKVVLMRNLVGILLSLALLTAVITALFFLLKIINKQKQLAIIKNDFISNITHEFKTPIATIGVAMESIKHFNIENDLEKTSKYVDMSSVQVEKLNVMVERLLDLATLDSQSLQLHTSKTNISVLLEHIYQSHCETAINKDIHLAIHSKNTYVNLDAFHMENAINNIMDNALKYGGKRIEINLKSTADLVSIEINDGGHNLTKSQAQQIFDKFYRVPKGNTHDIKGFGIGLYYAKSIIEKHGGSITVTTQPTTFKIHLPHA